MDSNNGALPPPPQVSPDGLFWWDGQKWVPRPQPAAQTTLPAQVVQTTPAPTLGKTSAARVAVIALLTLLVVGGAAAAYEAKQSSDFSDRQQQLYEEEFGR